MKKFIVLLKKEIRELITIQALAPIIIMVVLFLTLGNVISKEISESRNPQKVIVIDEDKSDFSKKACEILEKNELTITYIDNKNTDEVLKSTQKEKYISLILFPSGFGEKFNSNEQQRIHVYKIIGSFSPTYMGKMAKVDTAITKISEYFNNQLVSKFQPGMPQEKIKNPVTTREFTVYKDKNTVISFSLIIGYITKQASIIPIILFFVIFMSVSVTAGAVVMEKENKTLETLLSLPINRKLIIITKILSAGLVAILNTGIYVAGYKIFMNKIMSNAAVNMSNADLAYAVNKLGLMINTGDYVILGISVLTGILTALSIAFILGLLAENIRDTGMIILPIMILIMIPYLFSFFINLNEISLIPRLLLYAIPFTHPIYSMQKIIAGDYFFVGMGILYQLIIFLFFLFLAERILTSDKIITLKLRFRRNKH